MRTYTGGRNAASKWIKSTASADLSDCDGWANDIYKKICTMRSWPFMEGSRTVSTVSGNIFNQVPNDFDLGKIKEISVVPASSTITYVPKLSPSQEHWDQLHLSVFKSDIPEWYYIFAGQVGLWPTPATSGGTITLVGGLRAVDLSIADYTTGTIVSVANAGTAVVGSGTSWTANMVNLSLSITNGTAANSGDGQWYPISAVPTGTSITLKNPYTGLAISAGSAAYTLGQLPLLPEPFHDTPWKYAAYMYWLKETDPRSKMFGEQYLADMEQLAKTYSMPAESALVIDDGRDQQIINPNLVIRL